MITIEQIRKRLQNAIKESELSKSEICKKIGIKQPTLSQYLSGRAMPALDTFANLCVILDIDPADILCTNEKRERENQSYNVQYNNSTHRGNNNF